MKARSSAGAALALLLFAACGGPVAPWPSAPVGAMDLRIVVSSATAVLLQPITVQLDLYRRADLPVEFAPQVDAKDFLAETKVGAEVPFGAGFWQRTVLVLRPIRGPGELALPSFVARAKDGTIAASTAEQKIQVTSALADQGPSIEAPSAPLEAPSRLWWWVLAGYLGAALLAAAWYLWPRRRPGSLPTEVAVPPHVKAQRALGRLRTQSRTTQREIEAFYVEVSHVLRLYLEERFSLRAPERTTEEFLRDLEGGDQLAREHRRELERFLSRCDLVKFAAYVPTEPDHLATFALAESFVESTRSDRAPRVAATAESTRVGR